MKSRYRQLLDSLRNVFPQPVSDPLHDAYMVFSILRALEQVDNLKSDAPILGEPTEPNWQIAKTDRMERQADRWSK